VQIARAVLARAVVEHAEAELLELARVMAM
jgi:hypothetical protein